MFVPTIVVIVGDASVSNLTHLWPVVTNVCCVNILYQQDGWKLVTLKRKFERLEIQLSVLCVH